MSFSRLITLFSLLLLSLSAHAAQWQPKHVLVIHSYDPSNKWTSDFQKGIESASKRLSRPIKLSIEYLDTKRITSLDYYQEFQRYYSAKYANYKFDAVMITDDNALRLFKNWPDNPLLNLPVIAAGINDATATLNDFTNQSTILYEKDGIEGTLALIKQLRPELENLYLLTDSSHTSGLVRSAIEETYRNSGIIKAPLTVIEDISLTETANKLSLLSPKDAVLLSHYNTELETGTFHSYGKIAHTLASKSQAPIFVLWEFYIEGGVLGGYVNRSEQIGQQMVLALAQHLNLELIKNIGVSSSKRVVLDFNAVKRYKLDEDVLGDNVLWLNEPKSLFKENLQLIGFSLLSFTCLMIVIISQASTIRQKRELNNKSRKIVELQKKTMQVQKEMIHVLGEAIETRSGETGNHVKRVAKLSSLLGRLFGLSLREIEMLEIISPMHDVGKIAIPEAILDKPGKLSPEEWEVMKTHTQVGYELLSGTKGEVFQLAAIVAQQHHEKWDGSGYPRGLKNEQIHVFARITAIADVFDALLSVRCYKRAWSIDDVARLLNDESGKHFDPTLASLVLANLDEFIEIRNCYPDHVVDEYSIAS